MLSRKEVTRMVPRVVAMAMAMAVLGALAAFAAPPKVEICHVPPGNPDNARTIEVNENAVPAHLAHGDSEGACGSGGGGDDGATCRICCQCRVASSCDPPNPAGVVQPADGVGAGSCEFLGETGQQTVCDNKCASIGGVGVPSVLVACSRDGNLNDLACEENLTQACWWDGEFCPCDPATDPGCGECDPEVDPECDWEEEY